MTSLSLLCTHSLTSPPEPQKSPLTGPHAHPNPRPPASPTLFQPSPPPPAPRQSWWEGGHRSPGPGLGMPGCTGEHICPEHHRQGLALVPALQARTCGRKRCQRQTLPCWPGLTFTPSFFLFPPLFPPAEEKK